VSFLLSDECLVPQVDLDDSACKNTLKFSKKCFFCLDEQRAHDLVHDHLALVCRHQHPQSKEEFDRCPWQVWNPLHDPLAVDKQTVHHEFEHEAFQVQVADLLRFAIDVRILVLHFEDLFV